jgi:hypothetical protein
MRPISSLVTKIEWRIPGSGKRHDFDVQLMRCGKIEQTGMPCVHPPRRDSPATHRQDAQR